MSGILSDDWRMVQVPLRLASLASVPLWLPFLLDTPFCEGKCVEHTQKSIVARKEKTWSEAGQGLAGQRLPTPPSSWRWEGPGLRSTHLRGLEK